MKSFIVHLLFALSSPLNLNTYTHSIIMSLPLFDSYGAPIEDIIDELVYDFTEVDDKPLLEWDDTEPEINLYWLAYSTSFFNYLERQYYLESLLEDEESDEEYEDELSDEEDYGQEVDKIR